MKKTILATSAAVALLLSFKLPLSLALPAVEHAVLLEDAKMILEVNASDNDGEIVVEMNSDVAFDRIRILDPSHHLVLSTRSKDRQNLGLAEVLIESAEPNIPDVLLAYPEGLYRFIGRTTSGDLIVGHALLSHELLDQPEITFPAAGQTGVPTTNLVVAWAHDPEAEGYVMEFEADGAGIELSVQLPGSAQSFPIPDELLAPGQEYQVSVSAEGANGNIIVTEIQFST